MHQMMFDCEVNSHWDGYANLALTLASTNRNCIEVIARLHHVTLLHSFQQLYFEVPNCREVCRFQIRKVR
jgi:hypothetical protein